MAVVYGGPILKEPQCRNIGKQIESTLNCENPLVWPQTAKTTRPFSTPPHYRRPVLTFQTIVHWVLYDLGFPEGKPSEDLLSTPVCHKRRQLYGMGRPPLFDFPVQNERNNKYDAVSTKNDGITYLQWAMLCRSCSLNTAIISLSSVDCSAVRPSAFLQVGYAPNDNRVLTQSFVPSYKYITWHQDTHSVTIKLVVSCTALNLLLG